MSESMDSQQTCWDVIHGAAAGDRRDRSEFAQRYLPVVRATFKARWRRCSLEDSADDAVQEVFLECFRLQGALERADPRRANGFRAFLSGIVNNVALRCERRQRHRLGREAKGSFHPERLAANNEAVSRLFDREWAVALIKQAGELLEQKARMLDPPARKRVELLKLRFEDGLPIREIASKWGERPALVHESYRKVRREYHDCLREVVASNNPDAIGQCEQECERLLALLN